MPTLSFRMYDYDFGSANDEMGIINVNLLELTENKVHQKWHTIQPSPGCKEATGSIELSIAYSKTPPPTSFKQVRSREARKTREKS